AQHRVVGKSHVVADVAVVADMGARHEEAARADLGQPAAILGADIEGDALADVAVGADHQPGRPAAVTHRLRRRPERGKRCDDGARTDRGVAADVHVRDQAATFADRHMRPDHAIGPDGRVGRDLGRRVDHGRRMNARHDYPSEIMAPTSASATSWPATLASPRNHHIRRRCASFFMWYSTTSPGTTGRRNFALSMVRKRTCRVGRSMPSEMAQITPAVCAMPSMMRTPGITGESGKCPWKNGSVNVTFLIPMQLSSPTMAVTRSTSRNG